MASARRLESCPDENQILLFLRGLLQAEAASRVDAHFEHCPPCYGLLADLARCTASADSAAAHSQPSGTTDLTASSAAPAVQEERLPRGTAIGRYLLLDWLGAGGMGVVYSAYDPHLDRKIAVKVLRAELAASADGRARLLREAQALARLSHPNVISVHDAGTFGEQIFIAMQLLDGPTLTEWLAERQRSFSSLLAAFCDAGRGLAAAHAVGLVHRDFKPDNVLFGSDERVRVTDFGLVHPMGDFIGQAGSAAADPSPTGDGPQAERASLTVALTCTGAVVGTPAYMAPEQFLGRRLDGRADQFAFCVALYEALFGKRPFGGATAREVAEASLAGRLHIPQDSLVPVWMHKLLLRGLQPMPEDRFPSMEALLAAMHREAQPHRHRLRRGAAAMLGLGALVGLIASGQQTPVEPCQGAQQELAGIWDESVKQTLAARFLRTGQPYAAPAWHSVEAVLDRYAQSWSAMHTDACLATRIRGEQSELVLDLRMQCLQQRLGGLQALTSLLGNADAQTVEQAVHAANGLGDLALCGDLRLLRERVPPPEQPEVRARVQLVREELASAAALYSTSKYPQGLQVAASAVGAAQELGYRPLLAEALLQLGVLRRASGSPVKAQEDLQEARWAAEASRHDEVAAQAALELALLIGVVQSRTAEGMLLVRAAEAALVRMGERVELRTRLLSIKARILQQQGHYSEAAAALGESLQLTETNLAPGHPQVAELLTDLAAVQRAQGHPKAALELLLRSLALSEKALGPTHPQSASTLEGIGVVLYILGRYEEAEKYGQRVLAIKESTLGAQHYGLSVPLNTLAMVWLIQGRVDQAEAALRRALLLTQQQLGAAHPNSVKMLARLSELLTQRGKLTEAAELQLRATTAAETALGPRDPELSPLLANLAMTRTAQGHYREAERLARRAVALTEQARGPNHAELTNSLLALASVLAAQHRTAESLVCSRRALVIADKTLPPQHPRLATCHQNLAQRLREQGLGPQAREHYERALNLFEQTLGANHRSLVTPLLALGQLHLEAHQPDRAQPFLQRALLLCGATSCWPSEQRAVAAIRASVGRWTHGRRIRSPGRQ